MKQSWTQTLSTTVTILVLVVLVILALSQATNRIDAISLPSQPRRLASPLHFDTPAAASMNANAANLDMTVSEVNVETLRNDFLAFAQARDTLSTVGRNLTAGDLAADILAHAEEVFNEAYARSGALLGMDETLSEHLRTFESSLRAGSATSAAFAALAEAYDTALATSETVLHHATGEDMVLLLETFHEDLVNGANSTTIGRDLDALHLALMRQYQGEAGRARGFTDLSEHLHEVRDTLKASSQVDAAQLEALYEDMDAFFKAG